MCGFVAILGAGDPLPLALLNRMRDRLAHRGPDGAESWIGTHERGSVSLGFRRLSILDTRHIADQPMHSTDGRKVLVFNGEIYNFVELRSQLEAAGRHFRTRGDTEVLLQAYEEWGDAMLTRLNGMFAFALWDQDRGRALVARDRFGEKPLFACRLPDGKLAFASEVKALLAHPQVDPAYDLEMFNKVLYGRLLFGTSETLFRKIWQVRAGHCLLVDADGSIVSDQRYWQPAYDRALGSCSERQLIEQMRAQLERSVNQRMRSDVPVTACLSGGLDSSSLVALIASQSKACGRFALNGAMSVRFPHDPTIDEGHFIDAVLEKTGVQGHGVFPTVNELGRDLRRLHWHHETIVPGPSMYLEWALMREARALGYKVIIDGQGADEVLAGYRCYFQAWQAEMALRSGFGPRYARYAGTVRDMRLRQAAKCYANPQRRFGLNDSLAIDQVGVYLENHVADLERDYGGDGLPAHEDVGTLRFELAVNLMRTSLPSNLWSGDRNSMAHGIECRYPFLDYELVDFATHLPDKAYLQNGWGKCILRQALPDLLPRAVCWRIDKVGFAAPQDEWLRQPPLRAWIGERILDSRLSVLAGYAAPALENLWKQHLSGAADHSAWLWLWASAAELMDMQSLNEWSGNA